MLILVNRGANGGRGAERWTAVAAGLRARGIAFRMEETASADDAKRILAVTRDPVVIAAGGDGTVNGTLNALLELGRTDLTLGAIGLGSSNDFHKPFAEDRTIADVPVRIRADRAETVDVGRAVLHTPDGRRHVRHFVLNASLGFVAEGNAFFNTDDPVLRWLKRRHVEAAIVYTALRNVVTFRPIEASVRLDDGPDVNMPLTSLGILKNVHFAGGMKYDTPVVSDDGMFDVTAWVGMRRVDLIRTMANLYRGKFRGLPRTRTWRARRVAVAPGHPVHFETDGETTSIVRAELDVLPGALRVCR